MRKLKIGLALAAGVALSAPSAESFMGYRLLQLEGHYVKWGSPVLGTGATVTYALITQPQLFSGAHNCDQIGPLEPALARLKIDREILLKELKEAFAIWEQVANIDFAPAQDPSRADILIGAQLAPKGRAFANVDYKPWSGRGTKSISQSLICLNPTKGWKIGFDGDMDVYDLRYTLAHEIGHAIGLDHPGPEGQMMAFKYHEDFRTLQQGDVSGAVALYGARIPWPSKRPRDSESAEAPANGQSIRQIAQPAR